MNDEMFNELLESVKEIDRIIQGEAEPAQRTEFSESEVKTIRAKAAPGQDKKALLKPEGRTGLAGQHFDSH